MKTQQGADWFTITGESDSVFSAALDEKVQSRIAAGEYSAADVSYISKMNLHLTSGSLDVSDKTLEKLRRLCQLWDVSLKNREITSHRKVIGPVIVGVKKMLFPILQVLLKDFIRQQRAFNAAAVDAIADAANKKQN